MQAVVDGSSGPFALGTALAVRTPTAGGPLMVPVSSSALAPGTGEGESGGGI